MIKHLLKSQNGFSIVQGMMIASAVAGMGYVGTRMMQDQKLAQKGVAARNNLEQLHDMIYSILQNKDNCTDTMIAESLHIPSVWSSAANQSMVGIYTRNAAVVSSPARVFEINNSATYDGARTYMSNSVTIDSITLTKPAGLDFSNPANIEVVYRKLDSSGNKRLSRGYGGQTLKKIIPVKIQRTGAGAFLSCYAVSTGDNEDLIKDFCQQLGQNDGTSNPSMFVWSPALQQCVLKDLKCPTGQVFAGIDTNGTRRCARIQDWMNFNDLIDNTTTSCNPDTASAVRFVPIGNRVKIECEVCSPTIVTSCPAASTLGPNFVYSTQASVQGASWTGYGFSATQTTGTAAQSASICNRGYRNSVGCTNQWFLCQYNNTANTGCAP